MIQDELNGRSKPEVLFEWQAHAVRFEGLRTKLTPRLGELSMPVKFAKRATELIPGAAYREFAGCGHWLPRERRTTRCSSSKNLPRISS